LTFDLQRATLAASATMYVQQAEKQQAARPRPLQSLSELPGGLWRTARQSRLGRQLSRYLPHVVLALFVIPVAVLVPLALFWPTVRDSLDSLASGHEVGFNMLEHILVAAAAGAVAYWWLLGLKRQQALKSYRSRACADPEEFVEWSRGKPVIRNEMCRYLANSIRRSPKPAVAIVQGRAGTGRTSFIVGLVRALAEQNLIPIPVLAKRDGSFGLETLARETFCRNIDLVLSSERQADAIWRRAKATRDIVVLVDGLDDEVRHVLWRNNGRPFGQTVHSLHNSQIALVLATPGDLPALEEIRPMHEDLDVFNREEAERYIQRAIDQDRELTPRRP
jgi:hypothetical protein